MPPKKKYDLNISGLLTNQETDDSTATGSAVMDVSHEDAFQ